MDRRSGIPLSLLGLLVLLAIGASALALSEAPRSADLAVHNAVGETLSASSFRAVTSTHATTNGQSYAQGERISYNSPSKVVVSVSTSTSPHGVRIVLTHAQESTFFSHFRQLSTTKGWVSHGRYFTIVQPASSLVPQSAAKLVSGSVVTDVYVTDGYLTSVVQHIDATEGGQTSVQIGRFDFLEIGGRPVSTP
ncbi:MAG: hypothetical protein ACYDEP_00400 [Acidimicrobiales bacterium]